MNTVSAIPECSACVCACFIGCVLSPLVCSANTIWFVDAEHLLEALLEVLREEAIE